jgi:hypothetical protein
VSAMDSSAHRRAVTVDTGIQDSLRCCMALSSPSTLGPVMEIGAGGQMTGTVGIGVGAPRPEKSLRPHRPRT